MDRTDIHRPSAIVPADYEFVAFEYIKIDAGDILANCEILQSERAIKEAHMQRTGGTYATHEHGGSCMVCGASAVYTVLFYHEKTNEYIRTGQDCAQKMEMPYDELRYNAFRKGITDHRLQLAGKKKAEALLKDKGYDLAWKLYTETDAAVTSNYPYEERTVVDIISKQVKYGSVSERAMNYIGVLLNKISNRARIERERAEEAAKAAPVPTGRIEITGEIVSTRLQENTYAYGGAATLKMLVKDDRGFKVWGTAPTSLTNVKRGARVKFTAMVEPSKDDPKFGFFKRPTKAVNIDEPETRDPLHQDYIDASRPDAPDFDRTIVVACTDCGIDYDEKAVEVLDIEEDIQGRDVLTFNCPKGHHTKALRRG